MTPRILSVEALPPTTLVLSYAGGEVRRFDVAPYLDREAFRDLAEEAVFRSVRVAFDTVSWRNGADLDPDDLYAKSVPAGHSA